MVFADLILPLPLPGKFTYMVPENLHGSVSPGKRVLVGFGKKKIYSAIVAGVHNSVPEGLQVREIMAVLDEDPVVLPLQLEFWSWIATYYMCTEGEVLKAAMPAGLKLESETRLLPGSAGSLIHDEKEAELLEYIRNRPQCTVGDLLRLTKGAPVHSPLRKLIGSGAVITQESMKESYRPKEETCLALHPSVRDADRLTEAADKLSRAPRQLELLYRFLQIADIENFSKPSPEIPKKLLLEGGNYSASALNGLIARNILLESKRPASRLNDNTAAIRELSELNIHQQEALGSIRSRFLSQNVVLLDGVTSGGKTEIYMHLIDEELRKGGQVLYLLPEIALTAQMISRLKQVFGRRAGVYHSKFSDAERVEIWNNVLENAGESYQLILGARSALFLPFSNLRLVIIDEEHENTFKQFDPAPRYHARDTAIMLASMHGAKTLLGTATPSVESRFNAFSGKYGLVSLTRRYRETEPPAIVIADTREARKKRKMKSIFTQYLLDSIGEALSSNEQVILFQNRRGYAPFLECTSCGWIPVCRSCDVSMTWHKIQDRLVCHYCGDSGVPPSACPDCGGSSIVTRGFGTEKIEDEVRNFFPSARVARLDLDSVRNRKSHEEIIGRFEAGETDILAGTQMIAKGLDFGRVSLVGILNADNLLFFPDFRAHERSFQLISQVSGRAGRSGKRGKVVIQTGFPDHPVIRHIIRNDPGRHFREQLAERKQFRYPPFVRLIRISVKDKNRELVYRAASGLAEGLRARFGPRVLGPEFPPVGRIQNRYIMNILLKIEKGADLQKARSLIIGEINRMQLQPGIGSCQFIPDVDPF